jgi:hypothetical protein
MKLYEFENNFSLVSKDRNFKISFPDAEDGSKTLFVQDFLSGRQIAFNFSEEGFLQSYKYSDNNYDVATNIGLQPPNVLIERAEGYNGRRILYEFCNDGTTKVTDTTPEGGW